MLAPMITSDEGQIQVNVSIKNRASELPLPLTWTLGNFHISTNYWLISVVQYILLMINGNSDCGKLTINIEEHEICDCMKY